MSKTTMPRIVLTRPKAAAERFAEQLHAVRPAAEVIISPILAIQYLKDVPLPSAETLVFTSIHGVEGYRRLGGAVLPAFCVGEQTADAARDLGHEILACSPNLAALEPILVGQPLRGILRVRGTHTTGELALTRANLTDVVVYDQPVQRLTDKALEAFSGESAVVLPLFSPRSAGEVAKQIVAKAPIFAAFMSAAVQKRFGSVSVAQAEIAREPDAKSMVQATVELFDAACALEGRGQGD